MPGDIIAYPFAWPDELGKGSYDVTATLTGGGTSITLESKVAVGATLKGVAPASAPAIIAAPKGDPAWRVWAVTGLGIVAVFGFVLVMVVRYEPRSAASHRD